MKVPEFACGANAYLNNASVSPMPVASIRAVSEFLTKYSQIGPDSAESEPFVTETLRQTRKRISAIIRHSFECNLCDAVIIVYGGRFPSYS